VYMCIISLDNKYIAISWDVYIYNMIT
jgi:hypothetical protein